MATRTVTTVFAVQGESDYKTAVKNINSVLKELNSEMKLSEERYRGNESSVEALGDKLGKLQKIYDENAQKVDLLDQAYDTAIKNAQRYREENEKLAETISENRKHLEEMAEAGERSSDTYKQLAQETDDLYKAYKNNATQMQTSTRNAADFATQANDTRTEMEKLQREIDETSACFDEAVHSTDGYAHSMENAGDAADSMGSKTSAAVDTMVSALAAAGVEQAFEKIRDAMLDCADASIEFESALAGVFKTVSGTQAQLDAIEQGIKDLSVEIPATTTEIAAVAEAAGQLGIKTEDIMDFTEVMIKLGTSTNLSAEVAATSLAKFANITEMSADDYERLGSTIVDLGNKFATTEADIVTMATRMASTGDMVGMSEADMLAYATALSSVGVEAEAGGSAISKLFKKVETATALYDEAKGKIAETETDIRDLELLAGNLSFDFKGVANSVGLTADELSSYIRNVRNLEEYSKTAGMNPSEFIDLWNSDAAGALNKFIMGLGDMEEEGGNAVTTLSEMGLTEVRLSNAILALSSAGDLLSRTLETSETAWKKNTALADEAAKRYETTESKITILKNSADLLKVAVGDDFITTVEPAIEKLTDLTISLANAADESPDVSAAFAGIGGALAGLTGLTTAAAGFKAISAALSTFGSAAGPVVLTVTALTAAASAIAVYVSNATELSDAAEEIITVNESLLASVEKSKTTYQDSGTAIDQNRASVEKLIEKVVSLTSEMEQTPATQAMVQSAVDQLNEQLPNLGVTYDSVTGQINMTRDALIKFADEAANTAKLDALKNYLSDLTGQTVELEVKSDVTAAQVEEARQKYEEATEAVKAYTEEQSWLEKVLNYTSPDFLDLKMAVSQAKNELDELTKSQQSIQDALADTNKELETAQGIYDDYVREIEKAAEDAQKAGENVAKGFAKGITNSENEVISAAKRVALSADRTLRDELEINSPSKKGIRIGGFFGEGLAVGLAESENEVASAVRRLATEFDISEDIAAQYNRAQASIGKYQNLDTEKANIDYASYGESLRQMNRTAAASSAYSASMNNTNRTADITIIQQLDGKVLSREVSRVQWQDNQITARSRGVR